MSRSKRTITYSPDERLKRLGVVQEMGMMDSKYILRAEMNELD